jgi:hypothetical protein
VADHRSLDVAAAGAAYVTGDLATRFEDNYRYLRLGGSSGVEVDYNLMPEGLYDGLYVAFWANDRIRGYVMTPGHFSNDRGALVAHPPSTNRVGGGTIDPPLEGPGHLLRFPDLGNPERDQILVRWDYGPLDIMAKKGTDLLGLPVTLQEIRKTVENRR